MLNGKRVSDMFLSGITKIQPDNDINEDELNNVNKYSITTYCSSNNVKSPNAKSPNALSPSVKSFNIKPPNALSPSVKSFNIKPPNALSPSVKSPPNSMKKSNDGNSEKSNMSMSNDDIKKHTILETAVNVLSSSTNQSANTSADVSIFSDGTNNIHLLKCVRKGDLFNAVLWVPFIVEKCKTRLTKSNINTLLFTIYLHCVFLVISTITLSILIIITTVSKYKCNRITNFDLDRVVCYILTSIVLIMSIICEIRSSMSPLLFWWKIVKYSDWDFKCKKKDNIIEIINISAPKINVILRFIIILTSQILTYFCLLLSALIYIFNSDDIIEITKDSLAFIFILQLDEIIFNYMISVNPYFYKIWGEDANESTYVYKTKKEIKNTNYIVKMLSTTIFSLLLISFIVSISFSEVVHYCKKLC